METKKDYSFVRGFCYTGAYRVPKEQLKKELGYAVSLRLNSARIWLSVYEYQRDRTGFLERLKDFVRTAQEMGITTMPILFNGNTLKPEELDEEFFELGDVYVREVTAALKDEPGLLAWDVMNEPSCNDYIKKAGEEERAGRWAKVNGFLHHYCALVHALDRKNAVTIGHTYIEDVQETLEDVDVISFHDYFSTERRISATYEEALRLSRASGKALINSELCCLCRANPYDLALRKCREYGAGWYLFELMIGGYWGDVHGIFYADGTVRDPSIPAAVLGFYRNRSASAVRPNANKEGYAAEGIRRVKEALAEETEVFCAGRRSLEEVLEAAEFCANLLEACELVPMCDPPTAQIARIREAGDERAARRLAFKLAGILKEECLLL